MPSIPRLYLSHRMDGGSGRHSEGGSRRVERKTVDDSPILEQKFQRYLAERRAACDNRDLETLREEFLSHLPEYRDFPEE